MDRKSCALALALGVLAPAFLAGQPGAQAPGFKRTVIQKGDLSLEGYESVMAVAELEKGAETGLHTHPGEEISYVLDGTVVLQVEGRPDRTLEAGEAFLVEAGKIHGAKNASSGKTRVLATYVVEKGKPLTTPR